MVGFIQKKKRYQLFYNVNIPDVKTTYTTKRQTVKRLGKVKEQCHDITLNNFVA